MNFSKFMEGLVNKIDATYRQFKNDDKVFFGIMQRMIKEITTMNEKVGK